MAMSIFNWVQHSQAEDSPGGGDITISEVMELDHVLSEGLQTGGIPVRVSVTWLGDE